MTPIKHDQDALQNSTTTEMKTTGGKQGNRKKAR